MPNTAGATWSSNAISSDVKYASLKFVVKTHDNYNQTTSVNRPYFHMAKFDLFKLTSTVNVKPELGSITNDEVATAYDKMVDALYVYNNGATADELVAAYNTLKPLYDALKAKMPTTSIMANANVPAQHAIYNVAGQRLSTLQRGVNIVNGQKVIIK